MERLSRVVHRIHSPGRQTEEICFFSFRIFGTRIPAPFRPYATTSAALASISRMEETPTRNANGVWALLWMQGVNISPPCRHADAAWLSFCHQVAPPSPHLFHCIALPPHHR